MAWDPRLPGCVLVVGKAPAPRAAQGDGECGEPSSRQAELPDGFEAGLNARLLGGSVTPPSGEAGAHPDGTQTE